MNENTKIVFIHKGNSWYLPYVLYQAKSVNPHTDIVLIDGESKYKGIIVEPLTGLKDGGADRFRKNYLHMSSNPKEFELFCWERWFYLLCYMRRHNVSSVLHLDSDVLLYSSIDDIKKTYGNFDFECGLSIPMQNHDSFIWAVSGHSSYWTIAVLEEFCEFVLKSFDGDAGLKQYKKKWDWHIHGNREGGINDMTTLYLFWKANSSRVVNLAKSHNGCVFDHNVNSSDNFESGEYALDDGKKKIIFKDSVPYLIKNHGNEMDRVHAVHFQGRAKKYLRQYYTGGYFSWKPYYDFKGRVYSAYQRVFI